MLVVRLLEDFPVSDLPSNLVSGMYQRRAESSNDSSEPWLSWFHKVSELPT